MSISPSVVCTCQCCPLRVTDTAVTPVLTRSPSWAARVSVRNWIPGLNEVRVPPGPAAELTTLPALRSCFFFLARATMARNRPPYSRSSSAIRGKQETSDMVSGSPAKMPEAIGAISFCNASGPRRRRPKAARVSSPPGGAAANGSPRSRSLPGQESSLLLRKEGPFSGSRCSWPPVKMNRLRALSLLRCSWSLIPSAAHRSRVWGLLSRKPLGPHSQRKPFS